jgi:hypothetical protein
MNFRYRIDLISFFASAKVYIFHRPSKKTIQLHEIAGSILAGIESDGVTFGKGGGGIKPFVSRYTLVAA